MPRKPVSSTLRTVDVEIFGVHSFSGGAGKSVVSSLLALERSSRGRATYVIDTDLVGLGHLRSLYHEVPEPSSHAAPGASPTFWSIAAEGFLPPDVKKLTWPQGLKRIDVPPTQASQDGSVTEAPSESSTWQGGFYDVLPNLPQDQCFPTTCREIFLSNFHVGFVLERLAVFMSEIIARHVAAAKQEAVSLTFVLDCSPFVTALAEDIFLWLSCLALTEAGRDDASKLLDEVCFASATQFRARVEQALSHKPHPSLLLACRPIIVVIPDPYFGYPGRGSTLLSGPLFHQARNFASDLIRSRLFLPDSDNEKVLSLIDRTFPESSLFLANRDVGGGSSDPSHLVVPENRYLLARPERASEPPTSHRDHLWRFLGEFVGSSAKAVPSLRLYALWFDLDYALSQWRLIQGRRPHLAEYIDTVLTRHPDLASALTTKSAQEEWAAFTSAIASRKFTVHGTSATPEHVLPTFFGTVIREDPWCLLFAELAEELARFSEDVRQTSLMEFLGEPLERLAEIIRKVVSQWLESRESDPFVKTFLEGDEQVLLAHVIRAVREPDGHALSEVLAFWFRKEIVQFAQRNPIHPGLREVLAPVGGDTTSPTFPQRVDAWLSKIKDVRGLQS